MQMPIEDPTASLFKDRVPEAAARQVAIVLAWLAEEQLATLELMRGRKGTSARDLKRQQGIVEKMVWQCADLGVPPRGLKGDRCLRLERAMLAIAAEKPAVN